ncbi:hypothetical protein M3Y99_00699600 [Aphelenchoides fujianensis]|nr:hypothetical protein M3Y99_00699600 [Aphelenchoides fujianensis]
MPLEAPPEAPPTNSAVHPPPVRFAHKNAKKWLRFLEWRTFGKRRVEIMRAILECSQAGDDCDR